MHTGHAQAQAKVYSPVMTKTLAPSEGTGTTSYTYTTDSRLDDYLNLNNLIRSLVIHTRFFLSPTSISYLLLKKWVWNTRSHLIESISFTNV